MEGFLTLIDSRLHALLSEILQHCFGIKMGNNGVINLRYREKASCQPSAGKCTIDRTTKAVVLQGEGLLYTIECCSYFTCSKVDNGNQCEPFKVIIASAPIFNYVF